MDFAPVKSVIEQEVDAEVEERVRLEQMTARTGLARRFRFGALTYAEYKSLSERQQRTYSRAYGRPSTPRDAQAAAKKRAKKTKARKAEKQARKRSR